MNLNPSPKHRFQTEHKDACDAFRRITTSDTLRTALDFALLEYSRKMVSPVILLANDPGHCCECIRGATEFIDVLLNLPEMLEQPTKPTDTLNLKT